VRWLLDHGPSDLAIRLYPRLHPGLLTGAHHVPSPLSVLLRPIALLHHLLLLLPVNHLPELIRRGCVRSLAFVGLMRAERHLFLAGCRRPALVASQTLHL